MTLLLSESDLDHQIAWKLAPIGLDQQGRHATRGKPTRSIGMISFVNEFGESLSESSAMRAARNARRWRDRMLNWAYTLLTFGLFALLGVLAAWRM